MTIAQLFAKLFGPVEREAETVAAHVEADALSAVHLIEKEITMLSQTTTDALARIKADLEGHAADAARITGLNGQVTTLQGQVSDLTTQLAAANSDNAALVQDLNTIQAALLALTPDPNAAPAQ